MNKIAIVTDSNSGITQEMAKELGVYVLAMPFYIDGKLFFEGIDLTKEAFREKQVGGADIGTSQPSPGDVIDMWDNLLQEYEQVLCIPMSSGLSSTCDTAMSLARDYDGRVVVVDNGRISVTLKQSVLDALKLVAEGKNAQEIATILEANKKDAKCILVVDDLKYLKKGGRITPTAAAIGTVLNIKPVLVIQDEKIDSLAKVRGWKQAKKALFDAMEAELEGPLKGQKVQVFVVHNCEPDAAELFLKEAQERFAEYSLQVDTLPLSIVTHVGPGVMAMACAVEL